MTFDRELNELLQAMSQDAMLDRVEQLGQMLADRDQRIIDAIGRIRRANEINRAMAIESLRALAVDLGVQRAPRMDDVGHDYIQNIGAALNDASVTNGAWPEYIDEMPRMMQRGRA